MASGLLLSLTLVVGVAALSAPDTDDPVAHPASAERVTAAPATAPADIRVHRRKAVAGTTNDHTIRVTATRARLTGTVRIAIGDQFTRPQRTDPAEPGYITLDRRRCASAKFVRIERKPASGRSVVVATADCVKDESILFTYRDVSGPTKARWYYWRSVAKVNGAGGFRPVEEQPYLRIVGAGAVALAFYDGPSDGVAGEQLDPAPAFLVHDRYGNSTDYYGYVYITAAGTCPPLTMEGHTQYYPADDGGGWFVASVTEPCPDVTLTITANRLSEDTWGPFAVEP